jgi:hypothetical protein
MRACITFPFLTGRSRCLVTTGYARFKKNITAAAAIATIMSSSRVPDIRASSSAQHCSADQSCLPMRQTSGRTRGERMGCRQSSPRLDGKEEARRITFHAQSGTSDSPEIWMASFCTVSIINEWRASGHGGSLVVVSVQGRNESPNMVSATGHTEY